MAEAGARNCACSWLTIFGLTIRKSVPKDKEAADDFQNALPK